MMSFARLAAGFVAAALLASGAQAHPKLAAATPSANATVAAPKHITLRFSEKLIAKFSGADLVMTDMRSMKMNAAMKMPAQSMVMDDGKTLMVMPAKPLSAGTYKVTYHVVAGDSHRINGGYSFKVK